MGQGAESVQAVLAWAQPSSPRLAPSLPAGSPLGPPSASPTALMAQQPFMVYSQRPWGSSAVPAAVTCLLGPQPPHPPVSSVFVTDSSKLTQTNF